MSMRAVWLVMLAACGNSSSSPPVDASFGVPLETWTWVDVPGMACGNGSPTGFAINPSTQSQKLVMIFEGGGACWDAATCYGIVVPVAASHLDGYNAQTFASEQGQIDSNWAFQRSEATSPFHDATWVFIPYCTGDLHAGTQTVDYMALGQTRTMHHVGGTNVDAVLAWLAPHAFDQIFAIGISAGGFGVQLNWDRIAGTFPGAITHVLADGAQLVPVQADRWSAMKTQWAMRFPNGCTTCSDRLDNVGAHWRASAPAGGGRYGLLASLQDGVLGLYFGYDAGQMRAVSLPVATAMTGDNAAFMIDNTTHTMLGAPTTMTSTGVVLRPWVEAWAAGTNDFVTTGP